ncbi:MAG TPA: response regulator transcription factor [Planctomycetes bacterium]|nr:response regulator transcription factor [Planctomycetota bacterium]
MTDPIRLFLVDDQKMIRAAFRAMLSSDPRFEVLGDAGDARTAIAEVERCGPDVVLLDISMPGLSGLDAIASLRERSERTKVLMVTHHEGERFVDEAFRLGADGYISKDSDPLELASAIEKVHRGDRYVSPRLRPDGNTSCTSDAPPGTGRLGSLTPREREVFQLLALGRSNKEVARDLGISLGTAKKHRENLQRKLACGSTAELARLAIREGLME